MEPVLDNASGQPFTGVRYATDSCGNSVKNRLWKGYFVTDFDGVEARMDRLQTEFKPRSDDVYILAYLKCGTHWLHEICHFLLTRQAYTRPASKEDFMLECEDLEAIEKLQSPRVLNCHLRWSMLPASIKSANKIIYVVRNPKDCAVSLYNHYISINDYEYSGSFQGFLSLYESGQLDSGSWFQHTRDFLQETVGQGRSNVLMVQYELLKRNPKEQIQRIADFLLDDEAANISDELLESICEKVSFSSMKADRSKDLEEIFNSEAKSGFYRKGEVGDWKNWFSDEASASIDKLTAAALSGLEQLYQPVFE